MFNDFVDAFVKSQANGELQTYINDSGVDHTQNEYDCLAYLQGEFLEKMNGFKNRA